MFIEVITSSPLNVVITIVCVGLAYLYFKNSTSSSSSSSTASSSRSFGRGSSNQRGYPRTRLQGLPLVDDELQRARAQIERQERDMIRQEQDDAYQQSLKADREKRLKKEQDQKKKEEEEKATIKRKEKERLILERLLKLKKDIASKLESELNTDKNNSRNIVRLQFKLPKGSISRKEFHVKDKVKLLYWYVFSLEDAPLHFRMTTNFPKRELPGRPPIPEDFGDILPDIDPSTEGPNCEQSLEEVGLEGSLTIFVYDLDA